MTTPIGLPKKRSFDSGIMRGVAPILDEWFGVPFHTRVPPGTPMRTPPLDALYAQLGANLKTPNNRITKFGKNWRFTCETEIADHNRSSEKRLEKCIAQRLRETGMWANQVPICSGLSTGSDSKRAVDLVQRIGPKSFRIYELKTDSNTPFYAAAEVVLYGLTYLLIRSKVDVPAQELPSILAADEIGLIVVAPREPFYRDSSPGLREFETSLSEACSRFAATKVPGLRMRFSFAVLGPGFEKTRSDYSAEEIGRMVHGIRPLHPADTR